MFKTYSLKQKIGAIIYDLPRFLWAVRPSYLHQDGVIPWVFMHNRNERLIPDESKKGALCDWQWTSNLHIAKVFPNTGLRLMKRALNDWPIQLKSELSRQIKDPYVSFIIGQRGINRLPHLLITLKSIAGQRNISQECIVVEQTASPEIKEFLPSWVRYVHTQLPHPDMPYNRSWAFNVGARMAKGKLLVLHDNDMFVPQDYASQLIERYNEGYEVINLKRFIFYLNESHSKSIFSSGIIKTDAPPQFVVQNLEAGGSLAVNRDAYFSIGGFDEEFIGWGGEDNEFWERAQTLSVWPYGYLPIVHLWHEPQTEKFLYEKNSAQKKFRGLSQIPPETRINKLANRPYGSIEGPFMGVIANDK